MKILLKDINKDMPPMNVPMLCVCDYKNNKGVCLEEFTAAWSGKVDYHTTHIGDIVKKPDYWYVHNMKAKEDNSLRWYELVENDLGLVFLSVEFAIGRSVEFLQYSDEDFYWKRIFKDGVITESVSDYDIFKDAIKEA